MVQTQVPQSADIRSQNVRWQSVPGSSAWMIERRGPKCGPKVQSSMLQRGACGLALVFYAAGLAGFVWRSILRSSFRRRRSRPWLDFRTSEPENFAVPTKNLHQGRARTPEQCGFDAALCLKNLRFSARKDSSPVRDDFLTKRVDRSAFPRL